MKGLSKGRIIIFVVLALLAIGFRIYNRSGSVQAGISCGWEERIPVDRLQYVSHALCRMECREVPRWLVEDVYLHGQLNCEKSRMEKGKPRYAIEKRDRKGDVIRLIVQDEGAEHRVITVIRLDKEDKCECS